MFDLSFELFLITVLAGVAGYQTWEAGLADAHARAASAAPGSSAAGPARPGGWKFWLSVVGAGVTWCLAVSQACGQERERAELTRQLRRAQTPLGSLKVAWTLSIPVDRVDPSVPQPVRGPVVRLPDGRLVPADAGFLTLTLRRPRADAACGPVLPVDSLAYRAVVPGTVNAPWAPDPRGRAVGAYFRAAPGRVEVGSDVTSAFDLDSACVTAHQALTPSAALDEREPFSETPLTPVAISDLVITAGNRSWRAERVDSASTPPNFTGRLVPDRP